MLIINLECLYLTTGVSDGWHVIIGILGSGVKTLLEWSVSS